MIDCAIVSQCNSAKIVHIYQSYIGQKFLQQKPLFFTSANLFIRKETTHATAFVYLAFLLGAKWR
jgi:hypothetical protein